MGTRFGGWRSGSETMTDHSAMFLHSPGRGRTRHSARESPPVISHLRRQPQCSEPRCFVPPAIGSREPTLPAIWLKALTGGSSKYASVFRRLADGLPALLRRRPRPQPARARQAQRRLVQDELDQLIQGYKAGDDMKVLATRWRLHRTTVAAHLRRAGVALRRQGIPSSQIGEAVRLYSEGCSCQHLAARYACDAETVRQTLRAAGVQMRARRKPSQP